MSSYATTLLADDATTVPHLHEPILVRSRPVVDRLPLKVIEPVDVAINSLGQTLVADAAGRMLFRVDRAGTVDTIATDLKGLSRVVDSAQFGIHLLVSDGHKGHVLQFTDTKYAMRLAYLPFAPTGLSTNPDGSVFTSNSRTGEIIRIDDKDSYRIVGRASEPTRDLVVDDMGTVYILLASGKIEAITVAVEKPTTLGFVPPFASRLQWHPDGFVVALAPDADGRPTLYTVSPDDNSDFDRFAGVPRGTVAVAFDKLGNQTLANSRLRAVTRVTSAFRVKCQHCNKPTLMILSPDVPLDDFQTRRSF